MAYDVDGEVKGLQYTQDQEAVLDRVRSYESASKDSHTKRVDKAARIREYMDGTHGHERQLDRNEPLPGIQLTWWACEQQLPAIFNGYDFKPSVVAESEDDYQLKTDNELHRALQANRDAVPAGSDSEREAKMRTAILDYWWDRLCIEDTLKEATQAAQYDGVGFLLDGVDDDGDVFVDVVLSSDTIVDDDCGAEFNKARYVAYRVRRTLEYVRKNWANGEHVQPNNDHGRDAAKINNDPDRENVDVWCWFIRDLSTRTEQETREVGDQLEAADMMADGWNMLNGGELMPDAESWTLGRDIEVPKYNGGWRKVEVCNGVLLSDGDNPSASGNLPLTPVRFFTKPGEFWGTGMPDHVRDLNNIVDDMSAEGVATVKALKPFMAMMPGKMNFQSASAVANGFPVPRLTLKPDAAVDDDFALEKFAKLFPGGELSATYIGLMQQYQQWIELITGSFDLRSANNLPQDSSGRFVEAVEAGARARMSMIRANVRKAVKRLAENIIANVIAVTTDERAYKIDNGVQKSYPRFVPNALDVDIERRFDVVVGGAEGLPSNPIDRNREVMALLDSLAQKPPTLAMAQLDLLEIPNKEPLRAALDQHFKQMAEQAKQQKVDPDVSQKLSEAAADVLEEIGKKNAETDPSLAVLIAAELQRAAQTGQIDMQKIASVVIQKPSPQEQPGLLPGLQGGMQ